MDSQGEEERFRSKRAGKNLLLTHTCRAVHAFLFFLFFFFWSSPQTRICLKVFRGNTLVLGPWRREQSPCPLYLWLRCQVKPSRGTDTVPSSCLCKRYPFIFVYSSFSSNLTLLCFQRRKPLVSSPQYPPTWVRIGVSPHYFLPAVSPYNLKWKLHENRNSFSVISPLPRRELENSRHSTNINESLMNNKHLTK